MVITSKELSLFLWRLEEETPQLQALCREAGIPVEDLMELPVKRQRERAAERLLLREAFGRPVTLIHTVQGAPVVEDSDVNVSFSHTRQLVVLACSREHVIGVDAEQVDRLQVLKVRDKYLNDNEKQFIAPDDLAAHIIAWTAKEAIIKAERNSALDWTNGITLYPFAPGCLEQGEITFAARCGDKRYKLTSRLVDGHYITLATETDREVQ